MHNYFASILWACSFAVNDTNKEGRLGLETLLLYLKDVLFWGRRSKLQGQSDEQQRRRGENQENFNAVLKQRSKKTCCPSKKIQQVLKSYIVLLLNQHITSVHSYQFISVHSKKSREGEQLLFIHRSNTAIRRCDTSLFSIFVITVW